MREISTEKYGPAAKALIERATKDQRPKTLALSTPDAEALPELRAMNDQTISLGRRVRMPHDAEALRAGLWLLFDYMTESHDLSQNIATPSGSFWHGILHRREPDAFNAKYWFARCPDHPIFPELLRDTQEIAASAGIAGEKLCNHLEQVSTWDSAWFVDRCTMLADPESTRILLEMQRREWRLLFDYNFSKAFA